jgi:hypothetical protein
MTLCQANYFVLDLLTAMSASLGTTQGCNPFVRISASKGC